MKKEKKKFKHFKLPERQDLKEYLESEKFKKKDGTPNYSKIGKVMNKSRNTIRLESKILKEEYDPKKANDDYKNTLILSKTLDEIKKIINMTIWKLILCKIMILL
ncbi:hypothetical protein [Spiroplasma endosymbiont of Sarcophaga variegata]|uniref:hypothetical protein n=1 Tax=Spiroplasma endosymbiont of Sarcophaga variegata TaxID=3066304 RepID=UPI003AF7DA2F